MQLVPLPAQLHLVAMAATGAVDERLKDVDATVRSLLERCMRGEAIVQNVRKIFDALLSASVAYYMVIAPMLVGVHPENRHGLGLIISHVLALLPKILKAGWSDHEAFGVCTDIAHSEFRKIMDFNQRLVREAGGCIAACAEDSLKFASLWGSHTNQVLRMLASQIAHHCLELTHEGKLSLDRLRDRDGAFYNAAAHGMRWLVIPCWVLNAYPMLARFIQEAGNATSHVMRGEHDFQLMRKLAYTFSELKRSMGKTPAYSDVRAVVIKSNPKNQASLPMLFKLVMNFAGGEDLPHLRDCEAFVNGLQGQFAGEEKEPLHLTQEFLEPVTCDLSGLNQCTHWRWAAIKAACAWSKISFQDLKRATSRTNVINKVVQANTHMATLESLIEQASLDTDPMVCRIKGNTEIELLLHSCDKKECEQPLTSLAVAVRSIHEVTGRTITDRWVEHLPKETDKKQPAVPAQPTRFIGFGEDMTTLLMRNVGFNVSDTVANKEDVAVIYKIKILAWSL